LLTYPRRYRLSYLDRPAPPKGPPWAHNSLGASVHTALANWWKLPVASRTVAAGGRLLIEAWRSDGFRYVDQLDPYDEPIGVERTVALKTEHAALWGRVDRIDDRDDAGLVIVDYKTGRQVLTVDDARTSLALAVYAAGARRVLRRPCTRVELHHLPTGNVVVWEHTDDGLERHIKRADSIAAEIAELDDAFRAGVDLRTADTLFPASRPRRVRCAAGATTCGAVQPDCR
jgi:hypothetical protein